MKYACLVYNDATKLADLSEEQQLAAIVAECEAAGAWVAELDKGGHHVFSAGLQSVRTATTVRSSNGKLTMTDGPFAETKEFLGGFTIIEAPGPQRGAPTRLEVRVGASNRRSTPHP